MKPSYDVRLVESAESNRSIVCLGLDPVLEALPERSGRAETDLQNFFDAIFGEMTRRRILPGAFKPNIGYYHRIDRPREGSFEGSRTLAWLLDQLRARFPRIPIILDAKRGDIAASSANYAAEAFDCWQADAVTVSPFMGRDSVLPFLDYASCGVYVLTRTSNQGASEFQDLAVGNGSSLYEAVAEWIIGLNPSFPGIGAVVGATSPDELERIARRFAGKSIPMLIPGVGSQGAGGEETVRRLAAAGYDPRLARINSSSGITHPWKQGPVPESWRSIVVDRLDALNRETGAGVWK